MTYDFVDKIILGDCLEVLPQIPDGVVDLILCDPPYGIANEMVISRGSQGKYKGNDITNDFGEWDSFKSDYEHYKFTMAWCLECERILRPGGTFISFFDKVKLGWFVEIFQDFKIRDSITWIKNNPVPQVRKVKFAQAIEMGIVLQKPGGKSTFNWQLGYHPNYIRLPIVGGKKRLKDEDGKTLHPTQKPERLFRWLIDYFSNQGDLVVDPFCGTGTTAAACIRSGRHFICIEALPKYVNAALDRVSLVQVDLLGIDYKSKAYKAKYR